MARLLFRNGGRVSVETAPLVPQLCQEVFQWEKTRCEPQYPACLRTCRGAGELAMKAGEPGVSEERLNHIWDEICTMPPAGWVVHLHVPTWPDRARSLVRHPMSLGGVDMAPAIVYQATAYDGTLMILMRPYRGLSALFFDRMQWLDHQHHMITQRLSPTLQAYRERGRQRMASGAGKWDDPWVARLLDEVPGLA